ncbi:impE family protein [Escherichia coli]|uniref:ImpE family protein n=1 Tax=Escherichia coli TaxID=562 RepID=A0A2W6PE54_ECOLX|nr:impE family protein [Escherichia coli]
MTNINKLPTTLSALLRDYSLAEGIQMAELQVRMHPAQAPSRHSLFQLLCVAGDWSRALQQIQLCARMDANYTREAQVFGELIRCEIYRHVCFQGEQRPGVILPPPAWMEDEAQEADTHRSRALEAITDTSGQWNGGAFDWISDSDSRTGPVLELIAGGAYIWLPFSQICSLKSPQPAHLIDLIWKPVNVTLNNGDTHSAWLFPRYSGSEKAADSLRLCRETVWQDGPGETLVQALGQRVWLTGHGDISLLDLSTCTFNTAEGSDA